MTKEEKIAKFYNNPSPWTKGIKVLRNMLLSAGLKEDYKWNSPTYTYNNQNVISVRSFKDHFGLWFFQGALLEDKDNILHNAQEGKTKAMRQLKYEALFELNPAIVLELIKQAMLNAELGKKVSINHTQSKVVLPIKLKNALLNDAQLQLNFEALPLGKQREYGVYINEAKRESTKQRRLEKCIPLILNGKGLNDKYK